MVSMRNKKIILHLSSNTPLIYSSRCYVTKLSYLDVVQYGNIKDVIWRTGLNECHMENWPKVSNYLTIYGSNMFLKASMSAWS